MKVGHGSSNELDFYGRPVPISSNVAIGGGALDGGIDPAVFNSGQNITAVGFESLKSNTVGSHNTALGYKSLLGNTSGSSNTAIGVQASGANWTGRENVAVGRSALYNNRDGHFNTSIGMSSLNSSTGDKNTALGHRSGVYVTSGDNNTFIGYEARGSSDTVSNEITLGNADVTTVRMGNGDIIYPASGSGSVDAYTKAESDAIDDAQDDAIEAIQEEIAPWEPHGYLYVNNCVLSDEEGKRFDEFVGPKPGEIFFLGLGYFPVPNDNYTSINSIFISKYDNKGKELPFEKVEVYDDEGELVYIRYDVYDKFLKLVSPNGSANYKLEGLIPSTESPLMEELGYEGEEFYLLDLRTGESEMGGTIAEGEIVQITSPEDPKVAFDWGLKEIESKDLPGHPSPPVKLSSATTTADNITINKLSIGSSMYGENISNIMIGNEPNNVAPWWAEDYLPGLHWIAQDSGYGESQGNIAIGPDAMASCKSATENTAIGFQSLPSLKEGWNNTALGYGAGHTLKNGNNNTFIGHWAGPKGSDTENASDQVVLGANTKELWLGNNKIFPFPDDLGGGFGDAPKDGKTYARKDGEWSGTIEEAPSDSRTYARYNDGWTLIDTSSIPEPRGMNEDTWGRKQKGFGTDIWEWARVKEAVPEWYNYKGDQYWGKDAPDAGGIAIDNLLYSVTTAIKISTTELPGTSVSSTPMKDRLKTLKVGDSIGLQTTYYWKNANHAGGGQFEITGITEHDSYFEFTLNPIGSIRGGCESHDGVAVLLPGEVAKVSTDTYNYNLEVNGRVTVSVMDDNPSGTPVVVNSFGTLMKGASTYTAEEVDEKLALKDTLIEKLSKRLDDLEKRIK